MADTYINIDPDGDTLIILPLVQPASETDDAAWERSSLFNDNNDMDGRSSHSDEDEMRGNSSLSSDDGMEDEPSFPEYMPPETLSCYGQESSEIASVIASVSQVFQDNTKSKDTYYFKVSMKQLSLASPRAKAILLGPYRESIPTADVLRHWEFEPIFDPEAFKIVMSILHAQFHNVLDESSIAQQLHLTMVFIMPAKVFTLWVFSLEERFRIETHHAIMHSPDILSSFGLPIPVQILESLSQNRLSMLQEKLEKIQVLIKGVISHDSQCLLCASAAMGALTMNMHRHRLTSEDIVARSDNMSSTIFRDTLMSFTYPKAAACKGKVKPHVNLEYMVSSCTLESEFWGLDLKQF